MLLSEAAQGESTAAGMCEIMAVMGRGWSISWKVPNAMVMDAKSWDVRGEPPLSLDRATAIARSYLRSHGQPADRAVERAELIHPPVVDSRIPFFFYFIGFEDPSEPPPKQVLDVVVLLDGSVVPPKLTIEQQPHGPSNQALQPTAGWPVISLNFMKQFSILTRSALVLRRSSFSC